tara:strand:+ start:110 stop:289 length:180 start_codon:yes stop_codon:yes gene_type:complete
MEMEGHFSLLKEGLIIITQRESKKRLHIQVLCIIQLKIRLEKMHHHQMNNFLWDMEEIR